MTNDRVATALLKEVYRDLGRLLTDLEDALEVGRAGEAQLGDDLSRHRSDPEKRAALENQVARVAHLRDRIRAYGFAPDSEEKVD